MTMTMTMASAPRMRMSSQHITPQPARLHPSDDDLQSNSSKRRRKRRFPRILPMTSLAFLAIMYMYSCDAYALSMPVSGTRRSSILRYKVHHQMHSQSFNMSSGSRSRAKLSAMDLSPIQRLYRHRLNKDIIETTQSGRNRLLKIAQLTRVYFRKLGLGRGEVTDDTSTSGRICSSHATTSIAATTKYSPTTARMSSVQLSAPSTTTAVALHRQGRRGSSILSSSTKLQVLSTPDTIIEQASTQKLLDTLLDESVRTQSRQPVMLQFSPKRGWIWRQWRGTVFSETWKSGLTNMALATLVVFLYRLYPNLKDLLQGFSILWGQLLSVTTFTLTFFLNQSYGLWRKCYDYSRRLQGRLNDLGMTLAAHATRTKPSSPDIPSTYTPQSRQALELVSRYVRVFNLLTYASFTRSHRPILTPRGMRRLVERGILTPKEREILTDAEVPATQRHNAVLVWLIRLFLEGRQAGVFEGGTGFEQQFMEKCHVIRAQYGAIGDELQGRMPLAYAHIVQVLLDVVLWMYPFMALSSGMGWWFSILGTGLLTMFYQGLFDLAKQFLDPYDNENYGKGDDPLVIDTLIAETNAGSVRWMNSFQQQPWNRQRLIDGELYDSILPLRGYSLDDLAEKEAQEEKDRQEKEVAIKEKRRKEEEKDRQKAEQILMGHVENIKNGTSTAVSEVVNGAVVLTPAGEVLMSSVVDDEIFSNKTFIEVSGDGVVTSSPLSSQRIETGNKNESVVDGLSASTSASTSDSITDSAVLAPLDDTTNIAWANLGATPNFAESISEIEQYKASPSLSQFNVIIDEDIDEDFEDDLFQPINIEWFEEIGPDGNEYRLSQMLADEDWSFEEEDQVEDAASVAMTYDEFAQKATEIIEKVNSEIEETKEIMSVSPGSNAEYDVRKRESTASPASLPIRRALTKVAEPLYDQTRLDAISQLWGAPPEVLDANMAEDVDRSDKVLINDGLDFRNVYSLWGGEVRSSTVTLDDESTAVSIPSTEGLSQLWSDGFQDVSMSEDSQNEGADDFQAYAGLQWWNEVSEDGKELRLSQILADEVYDEMLDEKHEIPMTFERFAEETEKLIEQAEDERKETEAIMNAPPNASFLEAVKDSTTNIAAVEKSIAASDKFEEMILSLTQSDEVDDVAVVPDTDLDVLEMDNFPEGESSPSPGTDGLESDDIGNPPSMELGSEQNDE